MSVYYGVVERLGEGWKWNAMYGGEVRVRVRVIVAYRNLPKGNLLYCTYLQALFPSLPPPRLDVV
jgi:hypothetical protein